MPCAIRLNDYMQHLLAQSEAAAFGQSDTSSLTRRGASIGSLFFFVTTGNMFSSHFSINIIEMSPWSCGCQILSHNFQNMHGIHSSIMYIANFRINQSTFVQKFEIFFELIDFLSLIVHSELFTIMTSFKQPIALLLQIFRVLFLVLL